MNRVLSKARLFPKPYVAPKKVISPNVKKPNVTMNNSVFSSKIIQRGYSHGHRPHPMPYTGGFPKTSSTVLPKTEVRTELRETPCVNAFSSNGCCPGSKLGECSYPNEPSSLCQKKIGNRSLVLGAIFGGALMTSCFLVWKDLF